MKIEDNEFNRLKDFMLATYGIDLSKKRVLVESRLKQLVTGNGFEDFQTYIVAAFKQPALRQELVTRLTTNFTFFMREDIHFEFMVKTALPSLMEKSRSATYTPKIWSAGCSSGDEAMTAAMYLREMQNRMPKMTNYSITATDISDAMLTQAVAGTYSNESMNKLPDYYRYKYFTKVNDESYRVNQELSSKVKFSHFNLMDVFPATLSNFDIIFCRNVMIYFTPEIRKQLGKKFYGALKPGGYLFIGLSESLPANEIGLKLVRPSIFIRE